MIKKYRSEYLGTRIFYKLEKPIELSKSLGISLINCNTKKYGYSLIKISEDIGTKNYLDKDTKYYDKLIKLIKEKERITKDLSLATFNMKINNNNLKSLKSYKEFICSTNIVVKFEQKYEERVTYENKKIILPDEKRKNEVANYIYFINFLLPYDKFYDQRNYPSTDFLLILDDIPSYFLQNFIIIDDVRKYSNLKPYSYVSKTFVNSIENFGKKEYHLKELYDSNSINIFRKNLNSIIEISKQLEKMFVEEKFVEKFKFISNAIYIAGNSFDDRTSILLYMSIIESILTHKPDSNRFNVEDSITKQFVLKTCIIINKENEEYNVEKYSKRCKLFYSIRSDIAHGDTTNIKKTIKDFDKIYEKSDNFKDKETTYELVLETTREELRNILYHILKFYLKDSKYIEFLKNN